MKRQLLLAAFLMGSFFTANAQEVTYNFNDLNVGNIGTDLTGVTPGQGGWLTLTSNGTAPNTSTWTNAAFQVVANDATHANAFQIAGPNGAGGSAFMWQTLNWAGRTAGNDNTVVEFEYFTGTPEGVSKNYAAIALFNADASRSLGGFLIDKSTLDMYSYFYGQGQQQPGNVIGNLVQGGFTLPENVWVKLAFKYNYADGTIEFSGFNADNSVLFAPIVFDGLAPQTAVAEIDFMTANFAANNTASSNSLFDNLSVEFVGGTAGVEEVTAAKLSVFPNPAADVINVANVEGLNGIQIVDLNGRTVKSVNFNSVSEATVNVSDLTAGIYMMNIATEKGTSTQKIVKK